MPEDSKTGSDLVQKESTVACPEESGLPAEATGEGAIPEVDCVAGEPLPPPYRTLNARVVRAWRIENLVALGIVYLGLLIGGCALWALTPVPKFAILAVWLLFGCWYALVVGWVPSWNYSRWSFRMDEKVLELRFGIFWQMSVLIPLSRLQHIDLHRGPLERTQGLASLEIHTAGTKHASHRLPGLDVEDAIQLRDNLLSYAITNESEA